MAQALPTAVLGFGVTGQSVARYLRAQGEACVVCDTRPAPAQLDAQFDDVEFHWSCHRWPRLQVKRAVVSPGLALDSCLVADARAAGVPLFSDIDLFFEAVDVPVIGVTGTNGKSTVTSLVGHLLNRGGRSCGVGGNLGDAALDIIDPNNELYVLELSSFQLQRSRELPLHAATILNISDDHLDVHGDLAHYVASKRRIFRGAARTIYNRDDAATAPPDRQCSCSFGLSAPPGPDDWGVLQDGDEDWLAQGSLRLMPVAQLPLAGAHNVLNVLAACAIVCEWLDTDTLAAGLKSFRGLPHRFEKVAESHGVRFVNDSKATNLGATQAALAGLPADNQVLLIAGGDAKGADLLPLAEQLRGRVRKVFCIGADAAQVAAAAEAAEVGYQVCEHLPDAVRQCCQAARSGDLVLLSPACASLDMFTNYAERGRCFADAVRSEWPVSGGQR